MTRKPHAIMTMGLPGSGKSTVLNQLPNIAEFAIVDPDMIKATHPDYDPKNPGALHVWSKKVAAAQLATAIANNENVVVDGTGTNVEAMVRNITDLQAAGYFVEVLYVQVSLATAIYRNANRDRVVPVEIIREKAEVITTAADIVARYADKMTVVNND
jgi:predicted kinase